MRSVSRERSFGNLSGRLSMSSALVEGGRRNDSLASLEQNCRHFASNVAAEIEESLKQQLEERLELSFLLVWISILRRRQFFDEQSNNFDNTIPHRIDLLIPSVLSLLEQRGSYLGVQVFLQQSDLLQNESRSVFSESDEKFRESFRSSRILHVELFRGDFPVMQFVSTARLSERSANTNRRISSPN